MEEIFAMRIKDKRPTIFQQVLLISFNTLAAPKALQAENPPPIDRDHEVSARQVGAGLGAGRDRPLGVRQGREARVELDADTAPRKRRPKNGRAGEGSRRRRPGSPSHRRGSRNHLR